jgi:hypothetical protein
MVQLPAETLAKTNSGAHSLSIPYYQFNSDSKVQLSLIHNNVVFNPSNYTFDIDKKSKNLGSKLVYAYRFDALSAFYLGLSSNAVANDAINGLTTNQKVFS